MVVPGILSSPPAGAGYETCFDGTNPLCFAGFDESVANGVAGASVNLGGTCNDAVYQGEGVNSSELLTQSSQVPCGNLPYSWVTPTFPASKCASGCTSVLWRSNSVYAEYYEVFG